MGEPPKERNGREVESGKNDSGLSDSRDSYSRATTDAPAASADPAQRWLNAKRIRNQAILLALCIWGVVAVDFATPSILDRAGNVKFQDFLPYYVSGRLAAHGRLDELYDTRVTAREMQRVVPESAKLSLPVIYGPQMALFFLPFAALPFLWAAVLWVSISAGLYGLCCYLIWRTCPRLRDSPRVTAVVAVAFAPLFGTLVRGQNSAVALLLFVAAFLALRSSQPVLAGLAFGMVIFKPQLGLAAAVVMLAAGEWKMVAGALASASAQFAVGWIGAGSSAMHAYARTLLHIRDLMPSIEPGLENGHCLRAFWELLVPSPEIAFALYVITAVGTLFLAAVSWRARGPLALRFSALLVATVLVSPHLYVYDLLVLAPAYLLLSDWVMTQPFDSRYATLGVLIYLAYLLPLFGPVTKFTHLQISVLALGALQWMLYRILVGAPSSAG
jgi:glycosyl transferase family 87